SRHLPYTTLFRSPLPSRPMVNMPAFLYSVRALLRLLTFPTGTRAAAPAEVFQTVEVTPTERRDGMTTASALKAEAERKMAPKLWGSVIESSATTSGGLCRYPLDQSSINSTRSEERRVGKEYSNRSVQHKV